MRIKLTFRALNEKASIPINYNHAVSALIYKTVAESSPEFAAELHERGFTAENRQFKLFTFSRIETKQAFVDKRASRILLNNPYIKLQISSPVNEFLNNFVRGLFAQSSFRIDKSEFLLADAETLDTPEFLEEMQFHALSPITEAVRNQAGEVVFLIPENDWSAIITRNLQRKHQAFHGKPLSDAEVIWNWNENYFADERNYKKASKLIDIRGIKIRGWLAPFTVKGNVELIKLGYETGFGNRNSVGFGMAEVI
jgi:CRISPR-associated endoribonuclease Cas6